LCTNQVLLAAKVTRGQLLVGMKPEGIAVGGRMVNIAGGKPKRPTAYKSAQTVAMSQTIAYVKKVYGSK